MNVSLSLCEIVSSAKLGKLEGERVHEGVGVSEADDLAGLQGLAPVHEAVVVREPLEAPRAHHPGRGEPAAVEVNARRRAAGHGAGVHDLDNELWYPRGRRVSALRDAYVSAFAQ